MKTPHYLVRCQAQAHLGEQGGLGLALFDYRTGAFWGCRRCSDGRYCCDPDKSCCGGENISGQLGMDLTYLLDGNLEVLGTFRLPRENADPDQGPLEVLSLDASERAELLRSLRARDMRASGSAA